MKPVPFENARAVFAEDQEPYMPLPLMLFPGGETIQKWELTPEELEEVKRTGCVYVSTWTFGQPLQPLMVGATQEGMWPDAYEPCTFESLRVGDRVLLFNKKAVDNKFSLDIVGEINDAFLYVESDVNQEVPFSHALDCPIDGIFIIAKVRDGND